MQIELTEDERDFLYQATHRVDVDGSLTDEFSEDLVRELLYKLSPFRVPTE